MHTGYIHTTDILYLVQLQLYDLKLVPHRESKTMYSSERNKSSKLSHVVSTKKAKQQQSSVRLDFN